MHLGRNPGNAAWKYLPRLSGELLQYFRISVNNLFHRQIKTTTRHDPVRTSKICPTFFILWFHESILIGLQAFCRSPVQMPPSQPHSGFTTRPAILSLSCQRNSRCKVRRFRNGLNLTFSKRPGVSKLFVLRVVTYRDVGLPSAFASVHSRVIMSRGMVVVLQ